MTKNKKYETIVEIIEKKLNNDSIKISMKKLRRGFIEALETKNSN